MSTLLAIAKYPSNQIQLWTADTMEKVDTLEGNVLCFSCDCLRIATGCNSPTDTIRVWDVQTRQILEQYDSVGTIGKLEFGNQCRHLLAAVYVRHEGHRVQVWELGSKRQLMELQHQYIWSSMFSSDDLHVIVGMGNALVNSSYRCQHLKLSPVYKAHIRFSCIG